MKWPEREKNSCFFVMLPKDQSTCHQLIKSLSPSRKIFDINLLDMLQLKKVGMLSSTTFEENVDHI